MGVVLGLDAKLKYKAGGQAVGGDYTELTTARDVTLNLEKGEADVSSRGGGGWRATAAALKDASLEFDLIWDSGDAGFAAVKDAWFNGTLIAFQVLDADSGEGLQADFEIISVSRSEPLEEGLSVSVTAKVAYSATAPSWIGA